MLHLADGYRPVKTARYETILKLPALFQIDLQFLWTRDIVKVCITTKTSPGRNPIKRRSLASKRKWMNRACPHRREEDVNQTTLQKLEKLP